MKKLFNYTLLIASLALLIAGVARAQDEEPDAKASKTTHLTAKPVSFACEFALAPAIAVSNFAIMLPTQTPAASVIASAVAAVPANPGSVANSSFSVITSELNPVAYKRDNSNAPPERV